MGFRGAGGHTFMEDILCSSDLGVTQNSSSSSSSSFSASNLSSVSDLHDELTLMGAKTMGICVLPPSESSVTTTCSFVLEKSFLCFVFFFNL